ncbi:MAG: response regulator transcription factor [Neisseriaceae bacterium]|nr:response regulator transcription factor [Neisseriaceae bacterium]
MTHPTDQNSHFGTALIVEDCPTMRTRLQGILQQCPVADIHFAASLAQAYAFLEQQDIPKLILVDMGLPDGNGTELIQWVQTRLPETIMVVVSAWATQEIVLSALRAGAVGYLLKEREDQELIHALQTVAKGGAPIDPFVAKRILQELQPNPAPSSTPMNITALVADSHEALSHREKNILEWVAQGLTNREISEELSLSRHTVDTHIRNIYRKLAVTSRIQALQAAKQLGLLS